MNPIVSFINMCIDNGYITQEQAPWLHYGIEKRITTFLISIPMLIVGSLISSPAIFVFYKRVLLEAIRGAFCAY